MADFIPSSPPLPRTMDVLPSFHEDIPSSPPIPSSPSLPSQHRITKPKRRPPITPKSFTRFFTPRSSREGATRISSSRKALQDITGTGRNASKKEKNDRREIFFADLTPKSSPVAVDQENNGGSRKRRRQLLSPAFTEGSSPLKRFRNSENVDVFEDALNNIPSSPQRPSTADSMVTTRSVGTTCENDTVDVQEELQALRDMPLPSPIKRKGQFNSPGYILQRSLTGMTGGRNTLRYQCETANFYSMPEDQHRCDNVADANVPTVPFCTASCNTNSLVAVGDEDGGIRLLETSQNDEVGFSKAFLTFQPHKNAIMDITFSSDDRWLATASGDQSACIIDMETRKVLHTLIEHQSSVKQIRFQPGGNDNVIATSSRDGTVRIWDLRCEGYSAPRSRTHQPVSEDSTFPKSVNTLWGPHSGDYNSRRGTARRDDVSVTAISFLSASRSNLLLTASEVDACVKLWDLRYSKRRNSPATPISTTQQPESHLQHRSFGLTSIALNTDSTRLYTVCRDNTVYAYSTPHLILGHAPELDFSDPKFRRATKDCNTDGLGPLYGFRHPQFKTTSFFVKAAIRPATETHPELLAVGSGTGSPVLFPTSERYLTPLSTNKPNNATTSHMLTRSSHRPLFHRQASRSFSKPTETISIYQHGTALVEGHSREVTDLAWGHDGQLITVGDDRTSRCWREDQREARNLRLQTTPGERWGCGWADVERGWDDDEE
ncbi:MAG: hypothetical protein M1834_005463 [Cirrosporium novae-zelandiae]|nr:MAG: hypothetical protein M1834_005463 [Cirrosporium novae-zelandiae]